MEGWVGLGLGTTAVNKQSNQDRYLANRNCWLFKASHLTGQVSVLSYPTVATWKYGGHVLTPASLTQHQQTTAEPKCTVNRQDAIIATVIRKEFLSYRLRNRLILVKFGR